MVVRLVVVSGNSVEEGDGASLHGISPRFKYRTCRSSSSISNLYEVSQIGSIAAQVRQSFSAES
jgi:hypothetical protein